MDDVEVFILNRYAASELAGALILGKFARTAEDTFLRHKLTWHCAEEARHATVWSDLIQKLNIPSLSVHDPSKKSYFSYASEIKNMIEFLCFVHVYELRVPFHFSLHKQWTSHQEVKDVLEQMIIEEGAHISWIKEYFATASGVNKDEVSIALKKYLAIEQETYEHDLEALERMGLEGQRLVKMIRASLPSYRSAVNEKLL